VNDTVPERWREAQKSCVDLHEDYEYKVRFFFSACEGMAMGVLIRGTDYGVTV